jgi:chromosome segregation ATPase
MGQAVPPDASTPIPKPTMIAAASARNTPLTTSLPVSTSASLNSPTTTSNSAPSTIAKSKETTDPSNTAALEELKRRVKENESQRTEVTGHINQLNIQLHRWQLRLNMLNERHKELQAELGKSGNA